MSTLRYLQRLSGRPFAIGQQQQFCWQATRPTVVSFDVNNRNGRQGNSISVERRFNTSVSANERKPWGLLHPLHLPSQFQILLLPWKAATTTGAFSSSTCEFSTNTSPKHAGKSDTKASAAIADTDIFGEASNLGLFAKFKLMYKKYWYVLIPVHLVTSAGWYGLFYYLLKSGVDIPSLLQYIHLSETIIQKVHSSDMGILAIAYLCFKVVTPLRYAVTLGGTTVAIKHLVQAGHIKPMPSKSEIIQMYEQKKADRAATKADTERTKSDASK